MYAPDEQQTASAVALAAAYGGDTTRDRPPCRLRLRYMLGLVVVLGFIIWSANVNAQPSSAGREFAKKSTQLLRQFCFDCHANELAEGDVDLERMASDRSFDTEFRTWQKAAAMLEQGKMPPEDSPQPSNSQRHRLVSLIRSELDRFANQQAGDPGPVVMRRLTSAEYNYSIQDLTGLDLDVRQGFVSDAVGGEGFTNTGVVQFVQDSILERYLDAAKQVAAHAVVGSGPIQFFDDPGKTGLELSAIHRIQEIYRSHGFRAAAGEGGEPFGLDRYPRAFYVAWRYNHRGKLGLGSVSLAELASEEHLDERFVSHIWSVLNQPSSSSPISEIVAAWRQLSTPDLHDGKSEQKVRAECHELYRLLHDWQTRLALAATHEEQASVLTGDSVQIARSHQFQATIARQEDSALSTVSFSVVSADSTGEPDAIVIWSDPRVSFRNSDGGWQDARPLSTVVSQNAQQPAFGRHPNGATIGSHDFVMTGQSTRSFVVVMPQGARAARLLVEAQLDLEHGTDCVVRCAITAHDMDSQERTISVLLADPTGDAFKAWSTGALEFARLLPQVSHREPAPSDRDPIPAPFDNAYNARERDYFHYKVKYHRDDRFLVEHILDDATRNRLDIAWNDLLGSFEYHDICLRFVADKYKLDLDGGDITQVDSHWIEELPAEPREYVRNLRDGYQSVQRALKAAQSGHVADVIRLASHAWRRPLDGSEQERLRVFYDGLKDYSHSDHAEAIRVLIARILVAPNFLFRAERPPNRSGVAALSDWELASRLSYLLWSSLPDAELRRAAESGQLSDPQLLEGQARRMLRDPKARRMATEFFGQWFGFYQFDRYGGVDPRRFPEFTDRLRAAMHDEAIEFFTHIVQNDRPVSEILLADYAFLNDDLAQHYGIDAEFTTTTERLGRVEGVNRFHRGGLLGLGAVLTVTSAPLRTSPVKRGDWILRRVMGTPVPPPPPDAGSIPADDVLEDGKTLRERLVAHRRQPSCANCHARIDPLGFSLENYDALGRWRDRYRDGKVIDASGTLSDGTDVSGPNGLRRHLANQERLFRQTLCTKLVGYALGRGVLVSDTDLIDEMMAALRRDDRFSNLIVTIVGSPQFCYHRGHDGSGRNVSVEDQREGEIDEDSG